MNGGGLPWWTPSLRLAFAAAVFAGSFFFRLSTFSITNDDFLHLSLAQQVVLGDVPVRDFIDPGEFLFYLLSAAVQVLFGRHLLSEVVLDLVLLSAGYALAYLLAFHATRSHVLGLLVTAIIVLLVPRLYSYPKIVLYGIALTMIWRYGDDQRDRRLFWIAAFTAMAFLFRHDHGVAIGAAMVTMLVLSHWQEGPRHVVRRVLLFGGSTAVLLVPFFVFLQIHVGLYHYVSNTWETSRAEYRRTVGAFPLFRLEHDGPIPLPALASPRIGIRWVDGTDEQTRSGIARLRRLSAGEDQGEGWRYDLDDTSPANIAAIVRDPHVADTAGIDRTRFHLTTWVHEPNVDAWFYYLTILLPVTAVLVVAFPRLRGAPPPPVLAHEVPKIVTAAVLATVMHVYLLRSASDSAIADVSVLTAVLGAWLLAQGLGWRRRGSIPARTQSFVWTGLRVTAALAVLGVTVLAAAKADGGQLFVQLARGSDALAPIDRRLEFLRRSTAPFDDEGARYLFECTEASDRLLVTTYAPQIHYQSGRGFAAGRPYFLWSFAPSRHFESFSLERLAAQRVPIVLATRGDAYTEFSGTLPRIHEYLAHHYREAGVIAVGGAEFAVLVDTRIQPSGTHGPGSLPCF
jgi:hypothetical protein